MPDQTESIPLPETLPAPLEQEAKGSSRRPRANSETGGPVAISAAVKSPRGRKKRAEGEQDQVAEKKRPGRKPKKLAVLIEAATPNRKPASTSIGNDHFDILELEEENRNLRKSLGEKLRAENADLRKRLGL